MASKHLIAVTHETLNALAEEAQNSARLRKNLNLHPDLGDPVQRLFNAMEPGTYIRPHRHARDNGWELMICLRGRFSILIFDETGQVLDRADLQADAGTRAVEIPAFTWHAVVSRQPGTIMFEVKPGPYSPVEDKDFASWAPPENSPETLHTLRWYAEAKPGDIAPPWGPNNADDRPAV